MLKKAIHKLKKSKINKVNSDNVIDLEDTLDLTCEVNLNTTCILPNDYCPDIHKRLVYYKRLAKANTSDAIDEVYQDIINSFGLPPIVAKNLVQTHYLRIKALKVGIQIINATDKQISIAFITNPPLQPIQIVNTMQILKTCKMSSNKLTWTIQSIGAQDKIQRANFILDQLTK
jgi:transcription-repair coupling factor (superfamily II helicase)